MTVESAAVVFENIQLPFSLEKSMSFGKGWSVCVCVCVCECMWLWKGMEYVCVCSEGALSSSVCCELVGFSDDSRT